MTGSLHIGDVAPPFGFVARDGAPLTNEACRGRKVVLYFYPKDDTSGCTKEAIDFNQLRSAFAACDTTVIGVSPDSAASHEKFKAKHGLDLELGSDESKAMLEAYGVWTQKSMYGRKYMGVERTTVLIGRDGAVAQIWPNVKVPGHAEAVLAAAQALA
ncbi:peroxiredoxin [Lichenihabitans sp. Uapishka_5]|uniref:peroxiredoxin n=1 Tax=Lichenihabitans sp. Uapishka_5 TaxID=3037302 RepID=UPI0029E7E285|nr:peroxiredoxin [Lichenihabitans sp. Uapishka_5]MDX7950045.1 peroxiredoxin [Lichenihabitans sp. Uapishka_5]